jgi:hypothetical protein
MVKSRCGIYLEDELVAQVKLTQERFAGCSNLSAIIEKLLIQWLQQFEVRE